MSDFDVFLSYNSQDQSMAQTLARRLSERGVRVWWDDEQLIPGRKVVPLLEDGIKRSKCGAVLVGAAGIGPWAQQEMEALLQRAVNEGVEVIPVLLPNNSRAPKLPLFLGVRRWVDLRPELSDAGIDQLIWGITGERPASHPRDAVIAPDGAPGAASLWPDRDNATAGIECYARLQTLCAQGQPPDAAERRRLWQAVKRARPASFLAWQLASIARWATPEYLEVDEHFTPLQVLLRSRDEVDGPMNKQQLTFDALGDALHEIFDVRLAPASVIFAPPGGGKSTLLRHYQLKQAQTLLQSNRLVFYTQLRDYKPDALPKEEQGTDCAALAWLEAEWRKQTTAAPPLADFMQQGVLTLLLDGLNEIPRDSDEAYAARVAEWRALVSAVEDRHPGVQMLFACRPLDYSQRLDAGQRTRLPEIEVQAMAPSRVKAFILKRFSQSVAEAIWAQLEDHAVSTLYSSPYALNLLLNQIDIDAERIEVPRDRAALFSGLVRARLRLECARGSTRFTDPSLLSLRDRKLVSQGKTRAHWVPGDTPLFSSLAALAFHIQDASGSNERWGSLSWPVARDVIGPLVPDEVLPDTFLEAGCDLGLFEDEAAQADDIRFAHHQLQEYFAARQLAAEFDADKLAVPWRSEDLPESTQSLLAQGGDDVLAELPTTGWEESALMAAAISPESEALIQALTPANLPLAGRCAAQLLTLTPALRAALQAQLIERTRDEQADLRARIAAAKALGELGDPRLRSPAAQGTVGPLLPAFVPVAGGTYRIGGDNNRFPNEQPEQRVTLAAFELARHPVTNAEYERFVQAGGYAEDAYWPGVALEWRHGEVDQSQQQQQQQARDDRRVISEGLESEATVEILRETFGMGLIHAKWWLARLEESPDAFEVFLQAAYPPPSGPFHEPRLWRSATFGHPAQPVVGVSIYEAQAYCHWLNASLGRTNYRLPSEAEWEAAGRAGDSKRSYPWGSHFDPLAANTEETRLGEVAPVGCFTLGDTPGSSLMDMCGNVWEWTATAWSEGEDWARVSASTSLGSDARRVVRGGSWNYPGAFARLGCRDHSYPGLRFGALGFRVCRSSPI